MALCHSKSTGKNLEVVNRWGKDENSLFKKGKRFSTESSVHHITRILFLDQGIASLRILNRVPSDGRKWVVKYDICLIFKKEICNSDFSVTCGNMPDGKSHCLFCGSWNIEVYIVPMYHVYQFL